MTIEAELQEVLGELAALEDDRFRAVSLRQGDDHAVNLSQLRTIAKRLKRKPQLASGLWGAGNTSARLLATLLFKPKELSAQELDAMVREIRSPKLLDWFIVNVVRNSVHAEELRRRWKDESDLVGRAGWNLTIERVIKQAAGLDLEALLDQIERDMKQAPERKQWAMNQCLAEIGIHYPVFRARAIAIGEKLAVLVDYPASAGCTPPYAPVWIAEMVRRREDQT